MSQPAKDSNEKAPEYLEPIIKFISENYGQVSALYWLIHVEYTEEIYERLINLLDQERLEDVILNGTLISELALQPLQNMGTKDLYEFYFVKYGNNLVKLIIILNEGDAWSGPPELAFHSKPIQLRVTWDELISTYPEGNLLLLKQAK